jgi:predicted nucleotidyltransferase
MIVRSDLMHSINEGYFLVTNSDLVFEVKGNVHPSDRFIAYVRYVPDVRGDRTDLCGRKYKKIYSLGKRNLYLRRNHSEFLWFDKYSNRVVQAVPLSEIKSVLNPVDVLKELRDRKEELSQLQGKTIELSTILVDSARIPWSSIGVTGSQLVDLETEKSDIDLVVYGTDECNKLYQSLEQVYMNYQSLEKYEGEILRQHTEFRWKKDSPCWDWLLATEKRKLLQGIYRGTEFFLRCVKNSDENTVAYADYEYKFRGEKEAQCIVTDDSQRIFTPCEYTVECDMMPNLKKLVSFRGRFTEHVQAGSHVRAAGRLEAVWKENEELYLQLVLGEKPSDYLVPTSCLDS